MVAGWLGPDCEIIADSSPAHHEALADETLQAASSSSGAKEATEQSLLSMLKRRPCSLRDIHASLGLSRSEAMKHLGDLQRRGLVRSEKRGKSTFYKASPSAECKD